MEKMQKLKIWLDKEEVNRIFIRRIGIPQYRLVDAVEVEDLQDIMNEFEALMRSTQPFIALASVKDSSFMNNALERMYYPNFYRYYHGTLRSDIPEFRSWRHMLEKYLGCAWIGNNKGRI